MWLNGLPCCFKCRVYLWGLIIAITSSARCISKEEGSNVGMTDRSQDRFMAAFALDPDMVVLVMA